MTPIVVFALVILISFVLSAVFLAIARGRVHAILSVVTLAMYIAILVDVARFVAILAATPFAEQTPAFFVLFGTQLAIFGAVAARYPDRLLGLANQLESALHRPDDLEEETWMHWRSVWLPRFAYCSLAVGVGAVITGGVLALG